MSDPSRSMLGAEQRDWLLGALDETAADWKLVASPSIMRRTWKDNAGEPLATALLKLKLMDEDGEGPDEDQWDGYPAERRRLLEAIRDHSHGNIVVLSADIQTFLEQTGVPGLSKPFDRSEVRRVIQLVAGGNRRAS